MNVGAIPLPLPPFPSFQISPVFAPPLAFPFDCSLLSLCLPSRSASSTPSPLPPAMERAHHERLSEGRITRSRARSLERYQRKEQQPQKDTASSVSPTKKSAHVFQADKTVESVHAKPSAVFDVAAAPPPSSPSQQPGKAKAVRGPQSLAEELAQARKEEGLTDFAGESQQTPALLRTSRKRTTRHIAVKAIPRAPTQPPPAAAAPVAAEEKEQEEEAPARFYEERKERPFPSFAALKEDTRDLFSTALPSPPPSPVLSSSAASQPLSTSHAFPPIFERHESALLSLSDLPSSSSSSSPFSSTLDDDKSLAWRLQQEEYDAASMAPRDLHTFLADLTYQPRWLRLTLSVFLVINVLLPVLFLPRSEALVTLACSLLMLGSAYMLYRVYGFTAYAMYSTALLLPSVLYLLDVHAMNTSLEDVSALVESCWEHPWLLLDPVVLRYVWLWATLAVQSVCLVGGMRLALKAR